MIYCVEDDDNIRELVIYTLETTGLKAKGFAEGTAFMEALAFDTPELILLDIMLPGEDGLELLKKLNRESGISMLFISHNLNVVRKLCTRTAVMQRGVLVEEGDTDQVFYHPQHPYTQKLIDAIPTRNRKEERP
mgnify:FL=1